MVSWPGRTTLAIWRAVWDGGQVKARRMASQSGWVKPRPSSGGSDVPQTDVLGVRHSTFASLRLGRISQSIIPNLFASWIP
ncbi:hypothetical protein HID58_042696 [Brassica napus]|uniref:Uncharacterized protein n=1 Tax=Brassica napus TaxID=3708 RepID=A0ABQ8BEM2_BRANA|nr:hypothetical protein HID58_042696 [Brassica napus]